MGINFVSSKELIVLKMGGSVITNKYEHFSARNEAIEKIAQGISKIKQPLVLIHGAGSYGHPLAKKYEIHKGYFSSSQLDGLVEIRIKMQKLGEILTQIFRKYGMKIIPIISSSCMIAENKRLLRVEIEPFRIFLKIGLIPMCNGDVVADRKLGFSIISGDQMATYLARELGAKKVIFGCDVDGIFTSDPKQNEEAELIPIIKFKDLRKILKEYVSETKAPDVTGGMLGKLNEINNLMKSGIEVIIMNLNRPEDLIKVMSGKDVKCTRLIPSSKL